MEKETSGAERIKISKQQESEKSSEEERSGQVNTSLWMDGTFIQSESAGLMNERNLAAVQRETTRSGSYPFSQVAG